MCIKSIIDTDIYKIFISYFYMRNFPKVHGRFDDSYGIGTSLVCDRGNGIKASNIVMKLFAVKETENSEWLKCVKLSDDLGKYTGDAEEIEKCLIEIGIKSDICEEGETEEFFCEIKCPICEHYYTNKDLGDECGLGHEMHCGIGCSGNDFVNTNG